MNTKRSKLLRSAGRGNIWLKLPSFTLLRLSVKNVHRPLGYRRRYFAMSNRHSVKRFAAIVVGTSVLTLLMLPAAYLWIGAPDAFVDHNDISLINVPPLRWETLPDDFLLDSDFDRRQSLIFFNGNSAVFRPDQLNYEELRGFVAKGLKLYKFDAGREGVSNDFRLRYEMTEKLFPEFDWLTTSFVYVDNELVHYVLDLPGPLERLSDSQLKNVNASLSEILSDKFPSERKQRNAK